MDHRKLARDTERVIHKYVKNEEIRRNYGTDCLLTRKEIHTIQLVGDTPGLNLRTLAAHHGVTKGAASQMVSRLCIKGFLDRRISQVSMSEISLFLTAKGQQALQGHEDYHAKLGVIWKQAMTAMSEQDTAAVEKFLTVLEDLLDKEGGKSDENSYSL